MSFLGRIVQFLFWVLVVSWAIKLLGRLVQKANAPRTAGATRDRKSAAARKRLVKDPVCGMHMAEELALPLEANGEVLHFCSQECRAKYEATLLRRAASA